MRESDALGIITVFTTKNSLGTILLQMEDSYRLYFPEASSPVDLLPHN